MRSWSNFGVLATPRRFSTVPSFLHVRLWTLIVVHWSPKILEMVLQPFPDRFLDKAKNIKCDSVLFQVIRKSSDLTS